MYKSVQQIIKLHTFYHENKYRYYPRLSELRYLFDLIEKEVLQNEAELPNYIRVIPYYTNNVLKNKRICQGTQEEYVFYLECRDNVTEEMIVDFWSNCYYENDSFGILNKQIKKSLLFLIDQSYPKQFISALNSYYNLLENYLIPQLYKHIKSANSATEDEMCLGEFSFEIHCN